MGTIDLSRLRIGNGVASDYTRTEFKSTDIIKSLCTFSEEHFRGILNVEIENNDSGMITVAADGFAFFLKMLLYRVYGRAEVKATVNCERRAMHVTFDLCGIDIDTAGLFEIAENSGFAVTVLGDSVFRLTTEVKRTSTLKVYASDAEAFLRYLYATFFINE